MVVLGIVPAFVHTEHNGDVFALGGCGDDHLFGSTLHVLRRVFTFGEAAGGFNHDVRAYIPPGNRSRVFLGKDANFIAVDQQ